MLPVVCLWKTNIEQLSIVLRSKPYTSCQTPPAPPPSENADRCGWDIYTRYGTEKPTSLFEYKKRLKDKEDHMVMNLLNYQRTPKLIAAFPSINYRFNTTVLFYRLPNIRLASETYFELQLEVAKGGETKTQWIISAAFCHCHYSYRVRLEQKKKAEIWCEENL